MSEKSFALPKEKGTGMLFRHPSFYPGVSTACFFCKTDEPEKLEYIYFPDLEAYVCEHCHGQIRRKTWREAEV